ncbi:hypothetical protein BDN72DRAFT_880493 [Pluteus cervinus]|uniref:Uncharacterized protein n=1 Tax=Pluteus cervinus TaxID=181527 RepID=A0ACD3AKP4_9AGAR|nr:hypothetical protein BDN72DRAFT_880493 [Pluteus cervinus]
MQASSTQTPESKEVAIEKLDNEIRVLTELLCRLKAQRNTFSLPYTLPDEILCEIFAIVQAHFKLKSRGDPQNQICQIFQWLPITHVSGHWRQVALACSQLWCEIANLPEAVIPIFLGRSGNRNLSVRIVTSMTPRRVHYTHPPALLTQIFSQNSRIEKLVVKGVPSFTQITPYLTSTPAPKLKELVINAFGAHIPDELFQGITPQLETLTLFACYVNLNTPLLMNNLTTLEVLNCSGSAKAWLIILQRMPRLSLLKLRSGFSPDAEEPIPNPEDIGVIPLLRLSVFDFRGYGLERDLDFLSHLAFPSQTQFKFRSATRNGDQNIMPPLIAFLRVHTQSRQDLSEMNIRAVSYTQEHDQDRPKSLQLTASDGDHCYLAVDINLSSLQVRTTDAGNATHLAEITSLPLSLTTSFTTNCDIEREGWTILSNRLPILQSISISEATVHPFLLSIGVADANFNSGGDTDISMERHEEEDEDLAEPNRSVGSKGTRSNDFLDPGQVSSESTQQFKSLKSINLEDISFEELHEAMFVAICARRDDGFPVEKIRFNRCSDVGATGTFLTCLRTLVNVVECQEDDLEDEVEDEGDMSDGPEPDYSDED